MRLSRRVQATMAAGLALAAGAVNAAPSYAVHQTVTGLTNESPSQIVQFAVGTPGTLINGTPASITFPAGATDTDLVGIDYRPRGGTLFAVGSQGTFYMLAPPATPPGNFTATRVNTPAMNPFTGTPTSFGFDFNPTVDRIRVVNNADGVAIDDANYNNYRFNPDNGAQVDGNHGQAAEPPPFPVGVQADGDLRYGDMTTPNIVASAYTNNFDGATYDDAVQHRLGHEQRDHAELRRTSAPRTWWARWALTRPSWSGSTSRAAPARPTPRCSRPATRSRRSTESTC